MEQQCSGQCIRRTLYAVIIGVSPVVICLLFIGFARLILHRLEIAYYRRHKPTDRRSSLLIPQNGRLALSYTPVSHAELQRIIQGEHQNQQSNDSHNTSAIRKAPRFIKSLLPRRELAPTSSILANLVIRHDINDPHPLTSMFAPVDIDTPLEPTFSIINEHDKRRPSIITITRESIETTTLSVTMNNNSSNMTAEIEPEPIRMDPLTATTKTTTTTVAVEEFLDFHSVSSLPCVLSLLDTVSDNDNNQNLEINKYNEDD
ncbi:unnamed protein product [Adineta steineri]|uniref:Uncharacterized protein n=1 Tax=Adineta steineri TaxID=433720 RepID=A0A814XXG8_9BILA|nr:unnamed protein product [Adineta steineri]CAF4171805.1 unnamed protein product [Adineta steineri]